jgi:hypothetical protein
MPRSPGHAFYDRLQAELVASGFDGFVEGLCAAHYSERRGRPSLSPGRYFRMLLVGYFEGIDSERGLEWRCADSLSLGEFLRVGEREWVPDHSWLSRTRARLPLELHDAVFTWVLQRLWEAALPIQGTPAQHYLATRGLVLPDGAALRFLSDAKHPSGARCMCMIALAVDDAGRGQAVHRTYLAPGGIGKAKLDPPRATLGPIGGAVVRLCQPREGETLVIGEGIESSLSAGLLTGLPAWAALSAGNMARVPLPDHVQAVWIASDHDAAGQSAAWQAADAFMARGRAVQVLTPDTAGEDFNDVVQRRAAQGVAHG